MQPQLSYRHRVITDDEVVFIRPLVAANPQSGQRNLYEKLCLASNWVQANGAPRHLGCRDRYIGCTPQARWANIALLAYNARVLILPWVTVPHQASHLLGRMARRLSANWPALYDRPIHFLETFIDPLRFRGTCCRAASQNVLGLITAGGKDAPTRPSRSIDQAGAGLCQGQGRPPATVCLR